MVTTEEGQAHGSGRSVNGYHLLDALTASHEAGPEPLFTRFGGHAHAVGFSMPAQGLAALRERMQRHSAERLTPEMLKPEIVCDAEVPPEDVTPELFAWIERCAPFGMGNAEPVFLTRGFRLTALPRVIQQRHICLTLAGPRGPRNGKPWAGAAADR